RAAAREQITPAQDVLRERFGPEPRGDAVKLRLCSARVGDKRRVEALSRAIEALLGDLEKRFQPRQLCRGRAQLRAAAFKPAHEAILEPTFSAGDTLNQLNTHRHGALCSRRRCWRAQIRSEVD